MYEQIAFVSRIRFIFAAVHSILVQRILLSVYALRILV